MCNSVRANRILVVVTTALGWLIHLAVPLCAQVQGQPPLTFEKDVRPILREYCLDCHGAGQKLEANLDLRLVRFITKGGDSGAAISAEQPQESLLLKMMASGDMPPGDARVPEEKVDIVRRWLAGGHRTARPEPESLPPGIPINPEDRSRS